MTDQLAVLLPAPLATSSWAPLGQLRASLAAALESGARSSYKAEARAAAPSRPLRGREAWVANTEAADRIAWERALLLRIRSGERAAFAELYRAYAPVLYRGCCCPSWVQRAPPRTRWPRPSAAPS